MQNYSKKILLTGNGTGGSVAPLLAVVNLLRVTRYALRANLLTVDKFFAILKIINPTKFIVQFYWKRPWLIKVPLCRDLLIV